VAVTLLLSTSIIVIACILLILRSVAARVKATVGGVRR